MRTPSSDSQPSAPEQPAAPKPAWEVATEDIESLLRQGDEHMEKEAWSAAIEAYLGVVAAHARAAGVAPRLSEAFLRRGVYFRNKKGDPRRAIRAFSRAFLFAADLRSAASAMTWRGVMQVGQGCLDGAIADFTEAMRLDPADAETYCSRGNVFAKLERYPEAIADFTKGLRIEEPLRTAGRDDWVQSGGLFFYRGLAYGKIGNYQMAVEDFSAAIGLTKGEKGIEDQIANLYTNRGTSFARLGQYDKALADYERALSLEPDAPQTLINRAYALKDSGNLPHALEEFCRILENDPSDEQAMTGRAKIYFEQGQYDQAIAAWTELLELDPTDPGVVFCYRGNAYRAGGAINPAIADYTEALHYDPKDAYALRKRAAAWDDLQEYEKAIADLTEGLQIDPSDPYIRNELAWLLATCPEARLRNGRQGVEYATGACETTEWKAAAPIDTLAAAHAECDEFAKAIELERRAIELAEPDEKEEYQGRLVLYLRGVPFREP